MASDDDILALCNDDLREIASALRSGRLAVPVSSVGLARIIGHAASGGAALGLDAWTAVGLDAEQMAWAIDLILRSRQLQPRPEDVVELVLTGPDTPGVPVRDTAAVVHELFAQAERSVVVVGYAVHKGQRVFKALADRMLAVPALAVQMYFDIQRKPDDSPAVEPLISRFVHRFRTVEWPANCPLPHLFFYPESVTNGGGLRSCLHAKCVIIDDRIALVSSANFTEAAQERNIEAGVLIRSPIVAERLACHFRALAQRGVIERIL